MATNELKKLASAVERLTTADGVYDTAAPGLALYRSSAPWDKVAVVYGPSLFIVAQGVLLADETYRLGRAQSFLVSAVFAVAARAVEAPPGRPCLAVRISLDPALASELAVVCRTAPPHRDVAALKVEMQPAN